MADALVVLDRPPAPDRPGRPFRARGITTSKAMEVADEIVVINDGRIEQIGTPDELYDRPANDFVMRFLGPVTDLGGRPVRPHDIDVLLDAAPSTVSAKVERLVRLGFEVRVDAVDDQGQALSVQLTRAQVESLTLAPGKVINLRPTVAAPPDPEAVGRARAAR